MTGNLENASTPCVGPITLKPEDLGSRVCPLGWGDLSMFLWLMVLATPSFLPGVLESLSPCPCSSWALNSIQDTTSDRGDRLERHGGYEDGGRCRHRSSRGPRKAGLAALGWALYSHQRTCGFGNGICCT